MDVTLLQDFFRGHIAFAPDGSPVDLGTGFDDWGSFAALGIAGAPDGTLFVASIDTFLLGIKPDGSESLRHLRQDLAADTHVTSTSEPVVVFPGEAITTTALVRYHVDGTEAYSHLIDDPLGGMKFALDAQDNAWYAMPSLSALRKVSPTGALVGTYALPAAPNP